MSEKEILTKLLKKHPSLNFAEELADICSPLKLLNINYFAHVNVNAKKQFSAISSNPYFAEHYLQNHYYNADIHMSEKNLGENVLWDLVNLKGRSRQMHEEAGQFGIKHTFTIIQKNKEGDSNYYHFASKDSHSSVNQNYLSHLNLLNIFILHFRNKVNESKHLSNAYNLKITSTQNLSSYSLDDSEDNQSIKTQFLQQLSWNKAGPTKLFMFDSELTQKLTLRQQQCLYFYIYGKSPKEIGTLLGLSKRTVEQYLENVKIKLNMQNKAQLIENALERLSAYSKD